MPSMWTQKEVYVGMQVLSPSRPAAAQLSDQVLKSMPADQHFQSLRQHYGIPKCNFSSQMLN